MIDDEHGRVGCDEAVGDGKSKRCLTPVELELDTCWDRHPCSSVVGMLDMHLGLPLKDNLAT